MKTTHACIARGLAAHADDHLRKTAATKTAASRRWLEDQDLVKLCKLFKAKPRAK